MHSVGSVLSVVSWNAQLLLMWMVRKRRKRSRITDRVSTVVRKPQTVLFHTRSTLESVDGLDSSCAIVEYHYYQHCSSSAGISYCQSMVSHIDLLFLLLCYQVTVDV